MAQFAQDHPQATDALKTGVYWTLTAYRRPAGFVPDGNDKVCRYTGTVPAWDCAADGFDALLQTILRAGVTGFSDWTVGHQAGPNGVPPTDTTAERANVPTL